MIIIVIILVIITICIIVLATNVEEKSLLQDTEFILDKC